MASRPAHRAVKAASRSRASPRAADPSAHRVTPDNAVLAALTAAPRWLWCGHPPLCKRRLPCTGSAAADTRCCTSRACRLMRKLLRSYWQGRCKSARRCFVAFAAMAAMHCPKRRWQALEDRLSRRLADRWRNQPRDGEVADGGHVAKSLARASRTKQPKRRLRAEACMRVQSSSPMASVLQPLCRRAG